MDKFESNCHQLLWFRSHLSFLKVLYKQYYRGRMFSNLKGQHLYILDTLEEANPQESFWIVLLTRTVSLGLMKC